MGFLEPTTAADMRRLGWTTGATPLVETAFYNMFVQALNGANIAVDPSTGFGVDFGPTDCVITGSYSFQEPS